ncbi:hypothetical protein MFLAVUS_010267 [Mucor flavus]|uniref:No apical meristem-associated C-terminal domain-containing protein n=1 Tax=Mucor flavus TaxID=439312 RepID=A0ABP9ZC84_9FUNG
MDLTNRWTIIDEAVLKFSGFYQQAQYTQFNAVKKEIYTTSAMYQRGSGKPFDLAHCWDILRKAPRWTTQGDRMSMPRPIGTKRVKVAQANKKKSETVRKALGKRLLEENAMKESLDTLAKVSQERRDLEFMLIDTSGIVDPVYRLKIQKKNKMKYLIVLKRKRSKRRL